MAAWEAPSLRQGFDHRGHQCNACGMHHCHMQVIPTGPHRGEIVDEPEYEGWAGAGWAIGCTDPVAISWLNTQVDRACVDVNEFGWLIGWVMECQEKGYLTREQLGGLEVRWGDAEAAADAPADDQSSPGLRQRPGRGREARRRDAWAGRRRPAPSTPERARPRAGTTTGRAGTRCWTRSPAAPGRYR